MLAGENLHVRVMSTLTTDAAKSSEYLQDPQKKMLAGLNEDENAQSDSQMFKVTENANFLNSNPILLEYLAEVLVFALSSPSLSHRATTGCSW